MSKTVLICEDDKDIVDMTTLYLKKNGHKVQAINNCEAIWEAIEIEKPDLILMDLSIPKMGGAEATKLLKESDRTRDIQVYLMSAYPGISMIARYIGADGHLAKPFNIKDLKEIVG